MINIVNECKNPYFNLALEEYALHYLDPSVDYVIIWQNEPSVIIGRNQNTIEEINTEYIRKHQINVVRRLSGGGAVYHDLGNLNYTLIVQSDQDVTTSFRKFTEPVIEALRSLGVPAEFSGRNDIVIDGKKFSGNAQYWSKDRLLHHGTLLFNSDLAVVQEALNVQNEKLHSKGIKSVRSRVTNIYPYLKTPLSIEEFKSILLEHLLQGEFTTKREYILSEKDLATIEKLMDKRYLRWEWNYGHSPAFDFEKTRRFPGGQLGLKLNVKGGIIQDMRISGDFFGKRDVTELAALLIGKQYREETIRCLLNAVDFEEYFTAISRDNFIECLF